MHGRMSLNGQLIKWEVLYGVQNIGVICKYI